MILKTYDCYLWTLFITALIVILSLWSAAKISVIVMLISANGLTLFCILLRCSFESERRFLPSNEGLPKFGTASDELI